MSATTNTVKHTPGPWVVVESDKSPKRAAAWVCTVGNNPNDPAVFSTVLDGDKFVFGDKLADARLIAAAPDLLEALRNIAHEMRFMLRANPAKDGGLYRQRLDEADLAIAKATGSPVPQEKGGR